MTPYDGGKTTILTDAAGARQQPLRGRLQRDFFGTVERGETSGHPMQPAHSTVSARTTRLEHQLNLHIPACSIANTPCPRHANLPAPSPLQNKNKNLVVSTHAGCSTMYFRLQSNVALLSLNVLSLHRTRCLCRTTVEPWTQRLCRSHPCVNLRKSFCNVSPSAEQHSVLFID